MVGLLVFQQTELLKKKGKESKGDEFDYNENLKCVWSEFTNKIWDESTIWESASRVFEEGLAVRIEISPKIGGGDDIVVVSRIKKWITKDEQSNMVFRQIMGANQVDTCKTKQETNIGST